MASRKTSRRWTAAILTRGRLAPLLLVACAACASSRGEEIAANLKTIRHDQKPNRLVEIGKGYASIGDNTRAEEYFAAAMDQGADEREILPLLLRVCVLDGRYRSAIQYAENHLRKSPRDVNTRFVLGSLYSAIGDIDEARASYERVLDVEPSNADAHFAMAVLLRDTGGDAKLADYHFREYLRLKPAGQHVEEAQASLLKTVPSSTSPVLAPPTMIPPQSGANGPTRIDPPDAMPPPGQED